ncbi:MAG: anion permease [Desulfobacterales bacterium]|nr:anion permease [Desulfobacterales bacterium]
MRFVSEESSVQEPLISDALRKDPVLSRAPAGELAHMLMHLTQRHVKEGEMLFLENEAADEVYLIQGGTFVCTDSRENSERQSFRKPVSSGYLGQEAVLGAQVYSQTAVAKEPSIVIAFPTDDIRHLADSHPEIKGLFFQSWLSCGAEASTASVGFTKKSGRGETFPVKESVGWLAILGCMWAGWFFSLRMGIPAETVYYMAIIAAAVVMWVFQLVPAFAPPLFVVAMVILFDIVPADVAVTGFSSGSFFMLLSVFGVGAVMVVSGLTFRLSLMVLKMVPPSSFWYSVSLFVSGLFLTPVVPSQGARMAIVSPFLVDLLGASGVGKREILGARFVNSTLGGVGLGASIFLTGKPVNLIVLGLFDYQTQFAFQWVNWLLAASFTGVLMLAFFLGLSRLAFKDARNFQIPRSTVTQQLDLLGPVSKLEWAAMASVMVLILGILFSSVHKVDIPWMALAILTVLILFDVVGKKEIRNQIDWPTLLFVGAIIAWLPVMSLTGLDLLVAGQLGWLGEIMKNSFPEFIVVLSILIVLVRLVLPEPITVILFVTALFPLADAAGISPWIVGFIVLTMAEGYIFSYQCGYFIQLKEILSMNQLEDAFHEKRIVLFNLFMMAGRIVAIYASIPFWRFLNII